MRKLKEIIKTLHKGAYAHIPNRNWENDAEIPEECRADPNSRIEDIAYQMVYNEEGKKLRVILGGGRRNFINATDEDEEGSKGYRTDGRNLIDEWLAERNKEGRANYISHKRQLEEIDFEKVDFLLGLFESSHMLYRLDVLDGNLERQEPQLSDMVGAAVRILKKNENGFFLLVEGGRIGEQKI